MVQFETFWLSFDIIFENKKILFWYLIILEQTKTFGTRKNFFEIVQKSIVLLALKPMGMETLRIDNKLTQLHSSLVLKL
jgi:hypothetical protein